MKAFVVSAGAERRHPLQTQAEVASMPDVAAGDKRPQPLDGGGVPAAGAEPKVPSSTLSWWSRVPRALMEQDFRPRAIAVYTYLCLRADREGVCFPSRRDMALRTKQSLSTVDRALDDLCAAGWLAVEPQYQAMGADRRRRTTNRYRLLVRAGTAAPVEAPAVEAPAVGAPAAGAPAVGDSAAADACAVVTRDPSSPADTPLVTDRQEIDHKNQVNQTHKEVTSVKDTLGTDADGVCGADTRDSGRTETGRGTVPGRRQPAAYRQGNGRTTCARARGQPHAAGAPPSPEDAALTTLLDDAGLDELRDRALAATLRSVIVQMYYAPGLTVDGTWVEQVWVRRQLARLDGDCLRFVCERVRRGAAVIARGTAYWKTCLYHAPDEYDTYVLCDSRC